MYRLSLIFARQVALRKESVDRNGCRGRYWVVYVVALRKESVDRNNFCRLHNNVRVMVALRKESVDRNMVVGFNRIKDLDRSLSARRAWIEIRGINCKTAETASLSARRAWIEITVVATLATLVTGRSPQGERG